MFTDSEIKRMDLAELSSKGKNCIGTVLYVLGILDYDTYIGPGEKRWENGIVNQLLNKMTKVDSPQEGAILVIRGSRVEHMGLIVGSEANEVYHRIGRDNIIDPNDSLDDVLHIYSNFPIKEFYIK